MVGIDYEPLAERQANESMRAGKISAEAYTGVREKTANPAFVATIERTLRANPDPSGDGKSSYLVYAGAAHGQVGDALGVPKVAFLPTPGRSEVVEARDVFERKTPNEQVAINPHYTLYTPFQPVSKRRETDATGTDVKLTNARQRQNGAEPWRLWAKCGTRSAPRSVEGRVAAGFPDRSVHGTVQFLLELSKRTTISIKKEAVLSM